MSDFIGILQGVVGGLLVWFGTVVRERWQRDEKKREELLAAYSRCLAASRMVAPQLENLCIIVDQAGGQDRSFAEVQRLEPSMQDFLRATYEVLLVETNHTRGKLVVRMMDLVTMAHEALFAIVTTHYSSTLMAAETGDMDKEIEALVNASPGQVQRHIRSLVEQRLQPKYEHLEKSDAESRTEGQKIVIGVHKALEEVGVVRQDLLVLLGGYSGKVPVDRQSNGPH